MKKSELEKARASFAHNTSLSTENLKARVSRDLNLVKDAYDYGSLVLTELGKHLSLRSGDLDSKELANIAKAYSDISRTLIALRDEGRTTIREATAVDPPEPARDVPSAPLSDPPKISSPRATPLAIGQYLQGLAEAELPPESDDDDGKA